MKKIVLAVVCFVALGTSSYAQEGFGWGVKAGLTLSSMSSVNLNTKAGFTAGVFADYRFMDWFGVSADLLYSSQGARGKFSTQNLNGTVIEKLHYLNLPILANFYVWGNLAFKIGIQPGLLLSAREKWKNGNETKIDVVTSDYRSFDFAFPVGLSYEFLGKLILDARYNIGVANVLKGTSAHNNVFALTLGYRF